MKKMALLLIILLLLATACVYLFIPSTIRITKSVTIPSNNNALYRKLADPGSWNEWWPEKQDEKDSVKGYVFQSMRYFPGDPKTISLPVSIKSVNFSGTSEIIFIPVGIDSTTLRYVVSVPVPVNPFKRIAVYFSSGKLGKQISAQLNSINTIYSSTANLYNYDIQIKRVVDSSLIFTSIETKGIPDINRIYSLIDQLRDYIKKNDAEETGSPMLNIFTKDSNSYLLKVAIPVDKKLPSSGNISYRWMLGGGNILVTEVKGGPAEINKAYQQLLHYISDYKRVAPAIPFESLVTNRRNEPDSSKWITRIYYPVM